MVQIDFFQDVEIASSSLKSKNSTNCKKKIDHNKSSKISDRLPLRNRTNYSINCLQEKVKHTLLKSSMKSSQCLPSPPSEKSSILENGIQIKSIEMSSECTSVTASTSECNSVTNSIDNAPKDEIVANNPMTPNTARVSDLNSLRRTLRATMKSPKSHLPMSHCLQRSQDENVTTFHADKSVVPPPTPKSLLKKEMENDPDVSLLCSPNFFVRMSNDTINNDEQDIVTSNGISVHVSTASAEHRKTAQSFPKRRSRLETITEAVKARNAIGLKGRYSASSNGVTGTIETNDRNLKHQSAPFALVPSDKLCEKSVLIRSSVDNEDPKASSLSPSESKPKTVVLDDVSIPKSEATAYKDQFLFKKKVNIDDFKMSVIKSVETSRKTPTTDHNQTSVPPVSTCLSSTSQIRHWYSAMPASILHPNKSVSCTSFTPSGNGFCMDLTDIFVDAANKSPPFIVDRRSKGNNPNHKHMNQTPFSRSSRADAPAPMQAECDDWAQKQCQSLSQWLNYTFEPSEEKELEEADSSLDRIALRALVVHRRMAYARSSAMNLYKSEDIIKVRKLVAAEILKGRISIRKDRNLHADLTMRSQVMKLLFSYSTPWLRLGLETIFAEQIQPLSANSNGNDATSATKPVVKAQMSRMKLALKNFILTRVLSDDKILLKYTKGKCMVPSGSFEKKYNTELNAVVLHRLLVLILFLDAAKQASILDKVPNLFLKDAELKSSRDVLLALCRDFLQSEGDFIKHLSRLGIKVFFKQEPVDELEFSVNNLAVDLRDGTRLVKLVELITDIEQKSLLMQLRLPVVSRLQKLHNVGLALKELVRFGVPIPSDLNAHHIVDGHRPMVLKLLWTIVAHCCLPKLLDIEMVENEVNRINGISSEHTQTKPSRSNFDKTEALKSVLLRWCKAICSKVGIDVRNLTQDFSDGRIFCNLIHFYHPSLLRLDEINTNNEDFEHDQCNQQKTDLICSNERANAVLANKRLAQLGGIPQMVPICDSSNYPEEKSTLFCLTFMCSRLMESSIEIRAGNLIKEWLRKCYDRRMYRIKSKAALLILTSWRLHKASFYAAQYKKYKASIIVIEIFLTKHKDKLLWLKNCRMRLEESIRAAIFIQRVFRGLIVRQTYTKMVQEHNAAVIIQTFWRSELAIRKSRSTLSIDEACLKIQLFWKHAKLHIDKRNYAAVQLQRLWRGFWSQLNYQIDIFDIITVQCCARRKIARSVFQKRHNAVLLIQRQMQHYLARSHLTNNVSAMKIQCLFRRRRSHMKLQSMKLCFQSAVVIQSHVRTYAAKQTKEYLLREVMCWNSAVSIQSFWRRTLAQSLLKKLILVKSRIISSILIQSTWRSFTARIVKCRILSSVRIQANWRSYKSKMYVNDLRIQRLRYRSIIAIQSFIRIAFAKQRYHQLQKINKRFCAAISIQSVVRRYQSETFVRILKHAQELILVSNKLSERYRKAAIQIQSDWRRKKVYMLCNDRFLAATKLQSFVRMGLHVRCLNNMKTCAILIQSQWRAFVGQRSYSQFLTRVLACQKAIRVWRAHQACQQRRIAIQTILCSCRQFLSRKKLELYRKMKIQQVLASIVLQRSWRKAVAIADYHATLHRITLAQSLIRRYQATRSTHKRLVALVSIQKVSRLFLARRCLNRKREAYQERERLKRVAVVKIQSFHRGQNVRRNVAHMHHAAISIQRIFRGFLNKTDYQLLVLDVILTQIVIRQWFARRIARHRIESKILLQKFARRCLATFERNRHISARVVQRVYRGHVARTLASRHAAARRIQKTWRCYYVHIDFMLLCIKTISMQAYVRRSLCMRSFTQKYNAIVLIQSFSRFVLCNMYIKRQHQSATIIQATTRMGLQRHLYIFHLKQHKSASTIQSYIRMRQLRSKFSLQKIAAIVIERNVRKYLVNLSIKVQHQGAIQIQRIWRGYFAYTEFVAKVISAIKIQSFVRMNLTIAFVKMIKDELMAVNFLKIHSTRLIQKKFRQHQMRLQEFNAASLIQHVCKTYLKKIAFSKFRKGITRLQSFFRGRRDRKHQSKKVRIVAARVHQANKNAIADPRMQLSHRTRSALEILKKSRSLSEIMNAICLLELATRYSENCCKAFAAAGAPDVLFPLIRSCNRSLPHIEILRYVLLTLGNVAKFEYLLPSMASAIAVEVFLDLVQMFRDKDAIFPLAASLLDKVISSNDEALNQCALRENQKRLQGIIQLVVRKQSIIGIDCVHETRDTRETVSKSRLASSIKSKAASRRLQNREAHDSQSGLRALQLILRRVNKIS